MDIYQGNIIIIVSLLVLFIVILIDNHKYKICIYVIFIL